jgi:hypothetical protein
MTRVLGVGGIFLKSADPKKLVRWHSRHLGIAFVRSAAAFKPNTLPKKASTRERTEAPMSRGESPAATPPGR